MFTTKSDFLERAKVRLHRLGEDQAVPTRSDLDFLPKSEGLPAKTKALADPKHAAVLIGLVEYPDDFGVLLTLRPDTMAQHAGQVAFPGGRLDPSDDTILDAAIREAREEVGVPPDQIDLIGQCDAYLTSTGYLVSPFVALLPPKFEAKRDEWEVADVFETPLSFLMNPENHETHQREWKGKKRSYLAMPHNGRYIWGATAGMIRALYERLYQDPGM